MSKREILDIDDCEITELGEMSIISSADAKRHKSGGSGHCDLYFPGDDDKGLPSTDLNSELPEISIIERPPPRLKPPQSASGRAKGIIEREVHPHKFMTESYIGADSNKPELKTKLLEMYHMVCEMEKQKTKM
jgi:hypothetical protein